MSDRRIRSEAYYAESIERVWQALTDPARLAEWLTRGDFKLRRGHRFRWKEPASSNRANSPAEGRVCEIQEVEEPRRLSFRLEHSPDAASIVTWSLEPVGEGTRVIIEQELLVTAEFKPFPAVVSLALYRRQRALLCLRGGLAVLLEQLGRILAASPREAA